MHFRTIPRYVFEMPDFLTKKQPTQGCCFDDSFKRFADAPENEPSFADGNTSLLRLLSKTSNDATDSNGEFVVAQVKVDKSVFFAQKKFERQYEKSWNTPHLMTFVPVQMSEKWTIAILLKLLLVSWDFWAYSIGLKNGNIPSSTGNK